MAAECSVEVWEWMGKAFHPTLYWACDYLSMLGLKLIHVSKRGPGTFFYNRDWLCQYRDLSLDK